MSFIFLSSLAVYQQATADLQIAPALIDIPEGAFNAKVVQRSDNLTVMEFSGDYNKNTVEGGSNHAARAVVAREFYKNELDNYDFLIVFTSFDFDRGEARAFNSIVSNDVQGTGLEQFSRSAQFGSESRLKGFIDLGPLSEYEENSLSAGTFNAGLSYESGLRTLAHEILHNWAVHLDLPELVGRDGSHWSFFLDSDASIEYGSDWRDNGDGTFTAVQTRHQYSDLDLYLMGLLAKQDVAETFVVIPDDPQFQATDLPVKGATIRGQRVAVSVDDIVEIHGERMPSFTESQKEFRLGYIYLVPTGSEATPQELAKIRTYARDASTRFSILTGGRAIATAAPVASPPISLGESALVSSDGQSGDAAGNLSTALDWILSQQTIDGAWIDRAATGVRDTSTVVEELESFLPASSIAQAQQWLDSAEAFNVDARARLIGINRGADQPAQLISSQEEGGGFSVAEGYVSAVLDSALAACALKKRFALEESSRAASFVLSRQLSSGGWAHQSNSTASVNLTSLVLRLLHCSGLEPGSLEQSYTWLADQIRSDFGFGDDQSSVQATAQVLLAFYSAEQQALLPVEEVLGFLRSNQSSNGDWEGSVYKTAIAVAALRNEALPNIELLSLTADHTEVGDGQLLRVIATIRNTGGEVAPSSELALFEGDYNSNIVPVITILAPELAVGEQTDLEFFWSSLNKTGLQKLTVVADYLDEITEISDADNSKELPIRVTPAPTGIELVAEPLLVRISPEVVSSLPTELSISMPVRNLGLMAAAAVQVDIYRGSVAQENLVASSLNDIGAQSIRSFDFLVPVTSNSEARVLAVIDPDNQLAEQDESNNHLSIAIPIESSIDLEVVPQSLVVSPDPVLAGAQAEVTFLVKNNGTQDVAGVSLQLTAQSTQSSNTLINVQLNLGSGEEREISTSWLPGNTEETQLSVSIDTQNEYAETDETNNNAELIVTPRVLDGKNLSLDFKEFQVIPEVGLQGRASTFKIRVANTGGERTLGSSVNFYDGDPDADGILIANGLVPSIEPGSGANIEVVSANLETAGLRFIYAVVDPENLIVEIDETDNHAFIEYSVVSLPDLAVSTAAVTISPTLPRLSQPNIVSVSIDNLGMQAALNVKIDAYLGQGIVGEPIASDSFDFGAGETVVWEFEHQFTELGDQALFIVVDPDGQIEETNELNNTTQFTTRVSSTDFFVTNRFLSPNGDGVLDLVGVGVSLATAFDSRLVVLDEFDKEVKVLGQFPAGVIDSFIEWGGRNNFNSIVADGSYQLVLEGDNGIAIRAATVIVDNNRSALSQAIDTEFGIQRNLSCLIGEVVEVNLRAPQISEQAVLYSEGEDHIYFVSFFEPFVNGQGQVISSDINNPFPSGIYRANFDGTGVEQLLSDSNLDISKIMNLSLSPEDDTLFIYSRLDAGDVIYRLAISERDFSLIFDRPEIDAKIRTGFTAMSSDSVIFSEQPRPSSLRSSLIRLDTKPFVQERVLYEGEVDFRWSLNPDKDRALIVVNDQRTRYSVDEPGGLFSRGKGYQLNLLNIVTEELVNLASNFTAYSWSPDGEKFAAASPDSGNLQIFDKSANLIQSIDITGPQREALNSRSRNLLNFNYAEFIATGELDSRLLGEVLEVVWKPDSSAIVIHIEDHIAIAGNVPGLCSEEYGDLGGSEGGNAEACENEEGQFGSPVSFRGYRPTDGLYLAQLSESSLAKIASHPVADVVTQSGEPFEVSTASKSAVTENAYGQGLDDENLPFVRFHRELLTIFTQDTLFFELPRQNFQQNLVWLQGSNEIVLNTNRTGGIRKRREAYPILLNLSDLKESSRPIFKDADLVTPAQNQPSNTAFRQAGITESPAGRFINYYANRDSDACRLGEPQGYRQFQSVLNLTAQLRARATPIGGFVIDGTAMDLNFDRYELHFSSSETPEFWQSIITPAKLPIKNGRLANWAPPGTGTFNIRLTVFDKAGNHRQDIIKVFAGEQVAISGLSIAELYFSPNDDGIKEQTAVSFRVVKPVNIELDVVDEFGGSVRKITQSYDLVGSQQQIIWDGNDEYGQVVPDGEYKLRIQGFEYLVVVDTQPPSLLDTTKPLFLPGMPIGLASYSLCTKPTINQLFKCLVYSDTRFSAEVDDVNFAQARIEIQGDESQQWQILGEDSEVLSNGLIGLDALLSIERLRKHELRIVSIDRAGNESIESLGTIKKNQVHITGLSHGEGDIFRSGYGFARPNPFGTFPDYLASAISTVRFDTLHFKHSLDGDLSRVAVSYAPETQPSQVTSAEVSFTSAGIGTDAFRVSLPADLVSELRSESFIVSIQLTNTDGTTIQSDRQIIGGEFVLEFEQPRRLIVEPDFSIVTTALKNEIAEARVFLSSVGAVADPRYLRNDAIDTEGNPIEQGELPFEQPGGVLIKTVSGSDFTSLTSGGSRYRFSNATASASEPKISLLSECGFDYQLNLVLKLKTGVFLVRSFSDAGNCFEVHADVKPVLSASCSDLPTNRVALSANITRRSGSPDSVKPLFLDIVDPVSTQLIFRENLPELGQRYQFETETSSYDAGIRTFDAKLTLDDGSSIVKKILVPIVHDPPSINIGSPIDQSQICATSLLKGDSQKVSTVKVEGRIVSQGPELEFVVEGSAASGKKFERTRRGTFNPGFGRFGELNDNVQTYRTPDGDVVIESPVVYSPSRYESELRGLIAMPELEGDQNVTLSLQASNWSGAQSCKEIDVSIDAEIEGLLVRALDSSGNTLPVTDAKPNIISPQNGDGLYDELNFRYSVSENVTVQVEVFSSEFNDSLGELTKGDLVDLPYQQVFISNPSNELVWDGKTSEGQFVEDGSYIVEITSEDTCGNRVVSSFSTTVDNTKPTIDINLPNGGPISLTVPLQGSVSDQNNDTGRTTLLAESLGDQGVISISSFIGDLSGVVGLWDTYGLSGNWNLVLQSVDSAGNQVSRELVVSLPEREILITGLALTDSLISPNGDEVKDQLIGRLSLSENADVEAEIISMSGASIAQIHNGPLVQGINSLSWSGLSDGGQRAGDGKYRLKVTATNGFAIQTELAEFEIDITPPNLQVPSLVDGVIQLQGARSLIGSIVESNFLDYRVRLEELSDISSRGSPVQVIELVESTLRPSSQLATFDESFFTSERVFDAFLHARDTAGNEQSLSALLYIDDVPPQVGILEPSDNLILDNQNTIDVVGQVKDRFLNSYTVSLTEEGETQAAFSITDTEEKQGQLARINLEGLPDGRYTLDVTARDFSGQQSSETRSLVLDSTAPRVELTEPAEFAYLGSGLELIGSVADPNLKQYSVKFKAEHNASLDGAQQLVMAAQAQTEAPLFIWPVAPADGPYSIFLEAFDQAGNVGITQRNIRVDFTPPEPVEIITAEVTGAEEGILIEWQPAVELELAGYYLVRNGERLNDVLLATTQFQDVGLPEGDYTYEVIVADLAGLESVPSKGATVRLDFTPPKVQLFAPFNNAVVNLVEDISGIAFSEDDFLEYRVAIRVDGADPQQIVSSPVPVRAGDLVQWDTTSLNEGQVVEIILEAEDLSGNMASATRTVRVDNQAPAAPLLIELEEVSDVDYMLSWQQDPLEPDLLGFLVYRNGQLVSGDSDGQDLRAASIDETIFTDLAIPDGTHRWSVYAIDRVGNLSPSSNELQVSLDNTAPSARLIQPEPDEQFDLQLSLRAESEDTDVAQISFEFRRLGETDFDVIDIDVAPPFEFLWDTSDLTDGTYEIRGVATDFGGRSDDNPSAVLVHKADVQAPPRVQDVAIQIDKSTGVISWAANSQDTTAYIVARADCITCDFIDISQPIAELEFIDTVELQSVHYYRVYAVDESGNRSLPSEAAAGRYVNAVLTVEKQFSVSGEINAQIAAQDQFAEFQSFSIDIVDEDAVADQVVKDQGQPSLLASHVLNLPAPGIYFVAGQITSILESFTSRPSSELTLVTQGAPSRAGPIQAGFDSEARILNISWPSNPIVDDVAGYRILIDGISDQADTVITDATAFANSGSNSADFLPNSIPGSAWLVSAVAGLQLGQEWSAPRLVKGVDLEWGATSRSPVSLTIEARFDGTYIPIHTHTGRSRLQRIELPSSVMTDALRITVDEVSSSSLELEVMSVVFEPLTSELQYQKVFGTLPNSVLNVSVQAVNRLGGIGIASEIALIAAGDTTPPEPVSLLLDITSEPANLSWTASSELAPVYEVQLNGEYFAETTETELELGGLRNGVYRFSVIVLDEQGRSSPPSNEVTLTLDTALLTAPTIVDAIYRPDSEQASLTWEPFPGSQPNSYRVYQQRNGTGDFAEAGSSDMAALEFTAPAKDLAVLTVYVTALDSSGNESMPSAPVQVTIELASIYALPSIVSPAGLESPLTTDAETADIRGFAQPGASVFLLQDQQILPVEALATSSSESTSLAGAIDYLQIIDFISAESRVLAYARNRFTNTRFIIEVSEQGVEQIDIGRNLNQLNVDSTFETAQGSLFLSIDDDYFIYDFDSESLRSIDLGTNLGTQINKVLSFDSANNSAIAEILDFGTSVLVRIDSDTQQQQSLGLSTEIEANRDGTTLAGLSINAAGESVLVMIDVETENESIISLASFSDVEFSFRRQGWSPNGGALLLSGINQDGTSGFVVIDLIAQEAVFLPTPGSQLLQPIWLNNQDFIFSGRRDSKDELSIFSQRELSALLAETPNSQIPMMLVGVLEQNIAVLSNAGFDDLRLYRPAGVFEFEEVALETGRNRFNALSLNADGIPLLSRRTLTLDRIESALPDLSAELSLSSTNILVSETIDLGITVTNNGGAIAAPSTVFVRVLDSLGQEVVVDSIEIKSLANGESEAASTLWQPAIAGSHLVEVSVDPFNTLVESNENNNKRLEMIRVLDSALPSIELELVPSANVTSTYRPAEVVTGHVEIINPGPLQSGVLSVYVIAEDGQVAEQLLLEDLELFNGENRELNIVWSTEEFLLGKYRVIASFTPASGESPIQKSSEIELAEPLNLLLGLRSNRGLFRENEVVEFTALLANNSVVAGVAGTPVTLEVRDGGGNLIHSDTSASGAISAGASVDIPFAWNTRVFMPGVYSATVQLDIPGDGPLKATNSIEIIASESALIGSLLLDRPVLEQGQNLNIEALVANRGNAAVDAITLDYVLSSEPDLRVVGTDAIIRLNGGFEELLSAALETSELPLGDYRLQLVARYEGINQGALRLNEVGFVVRESVPPLVSIASPAANSVVQSKNLLAQTRAQDQYGIDSVDIFMDSAAPISALPSTLNVGVYEAPLNNLREGSHALRAKAIDRNGNIASSVEVQFTVDDTSPEINVLNIQPGQSFETTIQPQFTVEDVHLDTVNARVNGQALPHSFNEPGQYRLIIDAVDLAGNASRKELEFEIAGAEPELELIARDDSLSLARGVWGTVDILVNDQIVNGQSTSVEIIDNPKNGSVVNAGFGRYNYFPSLLFVGEDQFSYRLQDASDGESSVARVRIDVSPSASCSFVPDHSVTDEGLVTLPRWAANNGFAENPKYRIEIISNSVPSAFAVGGSPALSYPSCDLSYIPKAKTQALVVVKYRVLDARTNGEIYTSPERSFQIKINTGKDSKAIIVPLLQLLLNEDDE